MAGKPGTAPLSMTEKVGYGVGDMASNFYMGVINVFLLYYYTDVWGISPASAAFMFLITKVIDAVSDPAWVYRRSNEKQMGSLPSVSALGRCALRFARLSLF